jgi:NADPH:quinone reductase-like Zn-dependent oxidoreductase
MPSGNSTSTAKTLLTDAWVLRRRAGDQGGEGLVRETVEFAGIGPEEVLAAPIYGCWEGNMDHALRRTPVDVCELRKEDRVVLGNAGVVQILQIGAGVHTVKEGDRCIVFCNGRWDERGYPIEIFGYDAPGTMGVLAKRLKLHQRQVVPIPRNTRFSLAQWAAFSLRYVTAWANWRVAYGCWQAQMAGTAPGETHVFGWGGGVALAELSLAKALGCPVTMSASRPSRVALLERMGFAVIDRSVFSPEGFETGFMEAVRGRTAGKGAAIFVDNIGALYRLTLKALARQGVITTSGWKHQTTFPVARAIECINRHIHVFTHYARYQEGCEAVEYAEATGWMAPVESEPYPWEEIPQLAEDYRTGRNVDYFPIYSVNPSMV